MATKSQSRGTEGEPRFNERRITGAKGSRWFFPVYTGTNAMRAPRVSASPDGFATKEEAEEATKNL